MTIVRLWRGITLATKANQYLEYLNNSVAPAFQMAEGNEGLLVLQDPRAELVYFLLLSFWTSHEVLQNFTGAHSSEFDVVNLSPEEQSLLVAFESTARYYNVVYSSELSPNKPKLYTTENYSLSRPST
jgi:heme-degrading monooxygenase HmoA